MIKPAALFSVILLAAPLASLSPACAMEQSDPRLHRALLDLVRRPDGPPAAIAIIQKGDRRTVYSVGRASIDCPTSARPCPLPKASDYMRIASVSKAFSGAAALSLVSAGRLGLDDTIGLRLPYLPRKWHRVTLRQLLNHTSGLPDFVESKAFVAAVTANPRQAPAPRELLMFVADKPLNFRPGSRYRYSNSDNIAVGLMVEAATGKDYATVLRQRVYRPARLTNTGLGPSLRLPAHFIHGYSRENGAIQDVSEVIEFGGYAWASGGIVSTAGELNRFVRAYVGGKLFDAQTRRQQARFISGGKSGPPGPGKNAAGLGLFRYETRCGTVYGHTGNILGYTHFVAATRDGTRSITTSISTQLTQDLLPPLRRMQELAVCVALSD